MWYLISLENPDVKHMLLTSQPYIIGRKSCDILIEGDNAVSRRHAQIEVSHPEAHLTNPQKLPKITLTDLSKFGTTLNGDKLQTNDVRELHDGDLITFGNTSTFTLVYEPFIISSSCLDQPSKRKVKELLQVLGGHMVNEWKKECSLLIMNNISVTIKVVCALLSLKPIVTPEYLDQYVKHLQGKDHKPNPDSFLPVITETQVDSNEVSFSTKPERRNMFQGMKFIFLNEKQFKKMHVAVELGGGLPVLLEEKSQNDRMLVEKGAVVMQCDPNSCTQIMSQDSHNWVLHVQSVLRKHKKHMIQDAEIGYSVLYCSTDRHCNPDFDVGSQLLNPVSSQSVSHTDVLVENTEMSQKRSPTQILKKKCETVLDETKMEVKGPTPRKPKVKHEMLSPDQTIDDTSTRRSSKRGRSDDEEIPQMTPVQKKIKQEVLSPVIEKESRTRGRKGTISSQQSMSPSPATRSSSRRGKSPSPARSSPRKQRSPSPATRTSPRKQRSPSPAPKSTRNQRSLNKHNVKREIKDDSDEDMSVQRRKPAIVEDSDDEFGKIKGKRKCSKVENSDDEFGKIKGKRKGKAEVAPSTVSENDNEMSVIPIKSRSDKISKELINISDSEEELQVGRPKNTKTIKKEKSPSSRSNSKLNVNADVDISSTKPIQNTQSRPGKRKVLVEDSDDDIDIPSRGKRKHLVENSDDEFDKLMSRKTKKDKRPVSPVPRPPSPDLDHIEEENEVEQNNGENIKAEPGDPQGFVSTSAEGQEPKTTEYVKADDLPSRCINIQFVDLVARKPKKRTGNPDLATEGVPDGYIRWKGKVVRNFKKFKKTMNAGANALPRIIGGNDLVAHVTSARKDLDDWFKDAIQAESQQNETERKAQELFDWEPNKKRSR